MKLNQETLNVVANTNHKTTAFTIKATAQAMRHLSSTLYTHKIRAVIRELCCNAYDAHVAAGKKDVQFEVYAPTRLNMEFVVKDFGTGMSDKDIENLYSSYFSSTKSDSDDFTGALGLGSKSPFCYTDQFTIESRYNGHKSIYSAFYDSEQYPRLTKLVSTPTEEENGMTIKMAVKEEDMYTFYDEMTTVLQYFDVIPKCIGVSQTTSYLDRVKYKFDKFSVFSYNIRSGIVQGNVFYSFEVTEEMYESLRDIIGKYFNGYSSNFYGWFRQCVFKVPLGTVSFAINRECLSLDKKTVNNLIELIRECIEEHFNHFQKQITVQKSTWDRAILLNKSAEKDYFQVPCKFYYKFTVSNFRKNKKKFKECFEFHQMKGWKWDKNVDSFTLNINESFKVILCTDKKELRRMKQYAKSVYLCHFVIIFYPVFDKRIKQILTNKFKGYSQFINSTDIKYTHVSSGSSRAVAKNEWGSHIYDMEAWNGVCLSKRLDYDDQRDYPYHLKVSRYELDDSYGISRESISLLLSAFKKSLNGSTVLLCNSKSNKYDEKRDLITYLFSQYANVQKEAEKVIASAALMNNCSYWEQDMLKELKSKDINISLVQEILKQKSSNFNSKELLNFSNSFSEQEQSIKDKYKFIQLDYRTTAVKYLEALESIRSNYPLLRLTDGGSCNYQDYQDYVDCMYSKINGGNK